MFFQNGLRFRVRTWPKLMTLNTGQMTTEINVVGGVLDETLQDLRRIIFALRPVMLSEPGFLLSITHLAESVSKHNSIDIHTTITEDGTQLPEILEHTAFRIVQEALHNVMRHAHANEIWLTIKLEAALIDIEVRDDGVGFDTTLLEIRARQGHHGLVNLREREAAFKGSVVVSSHPGQGTTVHIQLPFETID